MEKGYDSLEVTGKVVIFIACKLIFDIFIHRRANQENQVPVDKLVNQEHR